MAGFRIDEKQAADDKVVFVPDEVLQVVAFDFQVHLGFREVTVFHFGVVGLKFV